MANVTILYRQVWNVSGTGSRILRAFEGKARGSFAARHTKTWVAQWGACNVPKHRYAAGLSSSRARYSLRAYPGRKNPTPETLCASRRFQKRFQKRTGVSGLG